MSSTAPFSPKIVVAGDVCIDWFAVPIPRTLPALGAASSRANWQLRDGLRMFARPGGAWLLADLIAKATGETVLRQRIPAPLENQDCECALHSMIELDAFPLSNSAKDQNDRRSYVWRARQFRGFSGPSAGDCPSPSSSIEHDNPAAPLVVIDDVGNGFRDRVGDWPKALERLENGPLVLWKLARPFGDGALTKHLWQRHAGRTILVLDVDDLRAEGAVISRQLSWERTAGDLINVLTHDRNFAAFRDFAHIVVRLDLEGAIHLANLGKDNMTAELTYLPTGIEGSTRVELPGKMLGFTSVL